MIIKIIKTGSYYEWYCDFCKRWYSQSLSFGKRKEFVKWIAGHLKRRHSMSLEEYKKFLKDKERLRNL